MNKSIVHITILLSFLLGLNSSFAQNAKDSIPNTKDVHIHSPKKAVLLALALPGAGQIYNKKYWKLPIVYGALGASTVYLVYNHNKFKGFDDAITIRENGEVDEYDGVYKTETLKDNALKFRNERDRAILITAGLYLLQVVDAYVDAHLFNFDISDDLSMNLQPAFNYDLNTKTLQSGIALNLSLR